MSLDFDYYSDKDDDLFTPPPTKRSGYFKTMTLTEYPVEEHLDKIFLHPLVRDEERKSLKSYCDAVKDGNLKVDYVMTRQYGRYYVKNYKQQSATTMWRRVRSTLYGEMDLDFDIKSCHVAILWNLVKKRDHFPQLEYYLTNRDAFIDEWELHDYQMEDYNHRTKSDLTKKDFIKNLVTRILYGGRFERWMEHYSFTNIRPPNLFKSFIEEISLATKLILNDIEYKPIKGETWRVVCEKEKIKYERENPIKKKYKLGEIKPSSFNPEKVHIHNGKHLSVILQDIERRIIDDSREFILNEGRDFSCYTYDGFQITRPCEEDMYDPSLLLYNLNSKVGEKYGVEFVIKPFAEPLTGFSKIKISNHFDENIFSYIEDYEKKKEYFETHHFKILSMDGFCYIGDDERIKYIKNEKFHFGFIYEWFQQYKMNETKIPKYLTWNIYPNPSLCPKNIFNKWNGFEMEREEYKNVEKGDYNHILEYFHSISDYDDKVYEFLLNWCAHLIQKPEIKTGVCLLFQGKQGTGKTTIGELMIKLMGEHYVFDTCELEKIVGRFNSMCQSKILGVLNEASGRDTHKEMNKIKDSITRTRLMLERKGAEPIQITDYCNFIYTSNNANPIRIDEDDRRFQVVRVSSKYKGNTDFWEKLYKDMETPSVMKAFYIFLKERNINDFKPQKDRIITEATEEIQELNKDHVVGFVEYLFCDEYMEEQYEYDVQGKQDFKPLVLYKKFEEWRKEYMPCTSPINNNTFLVRLSKNLKEGKITRRKSHGSNVYTLHYPSKCIINN